MEHVAKKSLLLSNGGAFIFEGQPELLYASLNEVSASEVKIFLTEYGFDIYVRNVIFPLQDNMIEHLSKQPYLVVFAGISDEYLLSPVYEIKVPSELIIEARGALLYKRSVVG